MDRAHIIIGGDICPTKSNIKLFIQGNREALIGRELEEQFDSSDFIMLNLETPLTNELSPIIKCGPCLAAPEETIRGLWKINSYFYTLGNNHIYDHGEIGLKNTFRVLDENSIEYSGAGSNIKEASKPYIKDIKGHKIGIYCCAEHEFSIVSDTNGGANPYDPLLSFDCVKMLNEKCEYVIVLYHGGKENYRFPSPNLQRVFRKFADVGADLVIAQHTHCVGCMEKYKESTLIYGQGNFLFDNEDNEYWNSGIVVKVSLDESILIDYIPVAKKGNTVRKANAKEESSILEGFWQRSEQIAKDGEVKRLYKEYALKQESNYYKRLTGSIGHFFPIRLINRLSKGLFLKLFFKSQYIPPIENLIECEAHRELFLQALKLRRESKR